MVVIPEPVVDVVGGVVAFEADGDFCLVGEGGGDGEGGGEGAVGANVVGCVYYCAADAECAEFTHAHFGGVIAGEVEYLDGDCVAFVYCCDFRRGEAAAGNGSA